MKQPGEVPKLRAAAKGRRLACGVGICDRGVHQSKVDGNDSYLYGVWARMITRCYSARHHTEKPTYAGCTVDARFLSFQSFCDWAVRQVGFGSPKFHLDKDLLIKGNKVYGPDTCSFVPLEINSLLINGAAMRGPYPIGVSRFENRYSAKAKYKSIEVWLGLHDTPEQAFYAYKAGKEEIIKKIANEYRSVISPRVYDALMAYEIHITD